MKKTHIENLKPIVDKLVQSVQNVAQKKQLLTIK